MKNLFSKKLKADKNLDTVPVSWLRETISREEVANSYRQLYGRNMEEHESSGLSKFRDGKEWSKFLNLLPSANEIRKFDSGFCGGIALVKEGEIVAHVTLVHYSRAH